MSSAPVATISAGHVAAPAQNQQAKMPSLIFDTCCGCIELRTGCLIIGYLNLVGEILLIVMSCIGLVGGGVVATKTDDEVNQDAGVAVIAISAVLLIVALFFLAFTIVLLVGIHKDKRGHVKAYLIVATICLVLTFITVLASFAHPNWSNIASQLFSLAVSVYFLLVIRSYYYKMDKRPTSYNTA